MRCFAHLYIVQGSNGGQWHAVAADDSDVVGADDIDVVAETIESPPFDVRRFALYRVVRRAVPPDEKGLPPWAYNPSAGAAVMGVYVSRSGALVPSLVTAGRMGAPLSPAQVKQATSFASVDA